MLSTFVLIPPLPMSTEGKIKINKKVDLQNFQFLLGSESCFVDTRQLVVIQLPVQISELNISTEGLKVRGKRGIDQTWTRHAAVAAGRVVHSVAHNELIFDSDKREREMGRWIGLLNPTSVSVSLLVLIVSNFPRNSLLLSPHSPPQTTTSLLSNVFHFASFSVLHTQSFSSFFTDPHRAMIFLFSEHTRP